MPLVSATKSRSVASSLASFLLFAVCLTAVPLAYAQLGTFDKEKRVAITHKWTGARAEDGRPLVPDEILKRLKTATAEEAWGVLRGEGYHYQFAGDWQVISLGQSGW